MKLLDSDPGEVAKWNAFLGVRKSEKAIELPASAPLQRAREQNISSEQAAACRKLDRKLNVLRKEIIASNCKNHMNSVT